MEKKLQRGQAITFRIPSDTPDHIVKQLQKLKETERRNFSSKIAEFVVEGVNRSVSKERETVTIPLPKQLSKEQRNWLRHAHSEALLGSILYQLLADPIRATTVLASLNSNALDIDEALYLQESDIQIEEVSDESTFQSDESLLEIPEVKQIDEMEDDLKNFDWNMAKKSNEATEDAVSDQDKEAEDLLGGFLAQMNK